MVFPSETVLLQQHGGSGLLMSTPHTGDGNSRLCTSRWIYTNWGVSTDKDLSLWSPFVVKGMGKVKSHPLSAGKALFLSVTPDWVSRLRCCPLLWFSSWFAECLHSYLMTPTNPSHTNIPTRWPGRSLTLRLYNGLHKEMGLVTPLLLISTVEDLKGHFTLGEHSFPKHCTSI